VLPPKPFSDESRNFGQINGFKRIHGVPYPNGSAHFGLVIEDALSGNEISARKSALELRCDLIFGDGASQ
jgi:hypothetical protein